MSLATELAKDFIKKYAGTIIRVTAISASILAGAAVVGEDVTKRIVRLLEVNAPLLAVTAVCIGILLDWALEGKHRNINQGGVGMKPRSQVSQRKK